MSATTDQRIRDAYEEPEDLKTHWEQFQKWQERLRKQPVILPTDGIPFAAYMAGVRSVTKK